MVLHPTMTALRLEVLFYTFIAIFVATAVVTLLGVVGVIAIPPPQLNVLLGAFLVELAGAVVALFRRTDFFARPTDNLVTALGSSIEGLDHISDEITATIKHQPIDSSPHPHGFLIQRVGDTMVAYQRMRIITAEDLEHLPEDQRALVRGFEKSMKALVREWLRLKRTGATQLNQQTRERQIELLRLAKDDLVGLLNFLERNGIYLDDHYMEVRSLVANL
jgi:hypothetical protein